MEGPENRVVLLAVVVGATGVASLVGVQSGQAPEEPELSWMEAASVVAPDGLGAHSESDAWLEWLAPTNEWSLPSPLTTRNYVPPPKPPEEKKEEAPKPVSKQVKVEFVGMYVSGAGDAVTHLRVDGKTVRLKVGDEIEGGYSVKDVGRDRVLMINGEGTEVEAPFLEAISIEVPLD